VIFRKNRPPSKLPAPISASPILGDTSYIASVLLIDLDENGSVLATTRFFSRLPRRGKSPEIYCLSVVSAHGRIGYDLARIHGAVSPMFGAFF
jgi:hypothetical protein